VIFLLLLSLLLLLQLIANSFNRLGQCDVSSDNEAYCYAKFAISFLAVAVMIASTQWAYPWTDSWADWPGWLVKCHISIQVLTDY